MDKSVHIDVDPIYGCHIWTGQKGHNGRPIIWGKGRRPMTAYQKAYEDEIGPVPEGHVLDHLCRRVLCVRPLHLEPVTQHENLLRRSWAYRCRRTHCPRGHEYAKHGLVTPEMGRLCRECERESRAAIAMPTRGRSPLSGENSD